MFTDEPGLQNLALAKTLKLLQPEFEAAPIKPKGS